MIELGIDIVYTIEIVLNFLKKTMAHKDLNTISRNYLLGYFAFDTISTIPMMMLKERGEFYFLKTFRMVHIDRLTLPQQLILNIILSKLSKKRQSDLSGFASLILYVIYTSHIMACIWIFLGKQNDCNEVVDDAECT